MTVKAGALAINGGAKSITKDAGDIFHWPLITKEDEAAVLEVLRAGTMSNTGITKQFEKEFAKWIGREYALGYNNGTEALRASMWACGVGAGDEVICPSMTYWASCAQVVTLGATVNFADIDPDTLCINPDDIEHRISDRTKLIIIVHYAGHPCDMDRIMAIADKHNIPVLEDVSHAHGGMYKGKMVGTFGKIAAMSMMSGKSFAIGEAGMMVTDDRDLFERCIAWGHYDRTGIKTDWGGADPGEITMDELKPYSGLPLGGYKHRVNQICSVLGLGQLKHYPARIQEIQKAMNRFWDLLEGVPGLHAHRPAKDSGSTMGGWYSARALYHAEELGGLPCAKFCEAVKAEGVEVCIPGANDPLHLHPFFNEADIYHMGKPTVLSFGQRDVRQGKGTLPISENISEIALRIPWFKHDRPEIIEEYAAAFRKVAENAKELL